MGVLTNAATLSSTLGDAIAVPGGWRRGRATPAPTPRRRRRLRARRHRRRTDSDLLSQDLNRGIFEDRKMVGCNLYRYIEESMVRVGLCAQRCGEETPSGFTGAVYYFPTGGYIALASESRAPDAPRLSNTSRGTMTACPSPFAYAAASKRRQARASRQRNYDHDSTIAAFCFRQSGSS